MKTIVAPRGRRVAAAAAVLLVIAGGAYAAIPSAAGVIHGCYRTSLDDQKGQLRVVDDPASCRNNETAIQWNEKGVAGATGATGTNGTNGVSPTATPLGPGNPHCTAGGWLFTDASGIPKPICNGERGATGAAGADGADFDGTFTSPNGLYSLSVTDAGVTVEGAGSTLRLDGNGIEVKSLTNQVTVRGQGISVRSDGSLSAMIDGALSLKAGTTATLEGGTGSVVRSPSTVTVLGSIVTINGNFPGCKQAARTGDLVVPSGAPGTFPGTIIGGAPTVCIG